MKNISHKRRDFVLKLGKAMGLASVSGLSSQVLAKPSVQQLATINSITLKNSGNGKLRLVFELDKRIKHKTLVLKSPDRVVVDFLNTGISNKPLTLDKKVAAQLKLIRRIRQSKRNDNDYRIVLDMAKQAKATTKLRSGASGIFLELELSADIDASIKSAAVIAKKSTKSTPRKHKKKAVNPVHRRAKRRPMIIALDAGHGGRDPGAVGKKGTKEKNIALQIAKRLQTRINRQPGMKAILIRDADYYVRLDKRIAKARTKRADIFVSIHADANPNRKLTGSSVYILSESGASSAAAKWLAQNENSYESKMADTHLNFKNKEVSSVLLDMSLSETIDQSLDLASNVLKELGGVNTLLRRKVESAAFAVLKSPDIPSMLVETAFISNPMEEKRLKSSHYQEKLAKAIFKGVRKYHIAQNNPNSRYT